MRIAYLSRSTSPDSTGSGEWELQKFPTQGKEAFISLSNSMHALNIFKVRHMTMVQENEVVTLDGQVKTDACPQLSLLKLVHGYVAQRKEI